MAGGPEELSRLLIALGVTADDLDRGLREGEQKVRDSTRRMGGSISDFAREAGRDFASLGGAVGSFSNLLYSAATGIGETRALYGALKETIVAAADFGAGMANVASLMPGHAERIKQLSGVVKDLALDVGKSTTDVTGGLYQVISAFGDTADTSKILEINVKAAAAGLSTTSEAIALTSAVTKGYGDTSAKAVQQVADLAFQTVALGQTNFPELAASIGRVTPLASQLGVSTQELFATFATFSGVTGRAAEVSTQFRGALQAFLSPTKEMHELLDQLGYSTGEAMVKQLGFQGAITKVVEVTRAQNIDLQKVIGSIEGQTIALSAAGAQSETFTQKQKAMGDATGMANKALDEQQSGMGAAAHQWEKFTEAVHVLAIDIGEKLLPPLNAVLKVVTAIVNAMNSTPENNWLAKLLGVKTDLFGNAIAGQGEEVPAHAKGYATDGPQIALIGEEGKEFVVPEKGGAFKNLAKLMGATAMAAGGMAGTPAPSGSFVTSLPQSERDKLLAELYGLYADQLGMVGGAGSASPLSGYAKNLVSSLKEGRPNAFAGAEGGAEEDLDYQMEAFAKELTQANAEMYKFSAQVQGGSASLAGLSATSASMQSELTATYGDLMSRGFDKSALTQESATAAGGFNADISFGAGRDFALKQLAGGTTISQEVLAAMFKNLPPAMVKSFFDSANKGLMGAGGTFDAMNTAGYTSLVEGQRGILAQLDKMNAMAAGMSEFEYNTMQANKGLNDMVAAQQQQADMYKLLNGDFSGLSKSVQAASLGLGAAAGGLTALGAGAANMSAGLGAMTAWGGKSQLEQAMALSQMGGGHAALGGAFGGLSGSIMEQVAAQQQGGGWAALRGASGSLGSTMDFGNPYALAVAAQQNQGPYMNPYALGASAMQNQAQFGGGNGGWNFNISTQLDGQTVWQNQMHYSQRDAMTNAVGQR